MLGFHTQVSNVFDWASSKEIKIELVRVFIRYAGTHEVHVRENDFFFQIRNEFQ